ncbi:hypothetical protein J659_3987 [Acinetobacter baumannii 1406589]|nr:hypothetical protein J659_3987 [Acinetobacter baumannii 1406589]
MKAVFTLYFNTLNQKIGYFLKNSMKVYFLFKTTSYISFYPFF